MAQNSREEFLLHRQQGEKLIAQFKTNSSKELELQAKGHLLYALCLAIITLRPAVHSIDTAQSSDMTLIQTLIPLFEAALVIHKQIENVNRSVGIFFDKLLAEQEVVLFRFKRILMKIAVSLEQDTCNNQCNACSSTDSLEEDIDNLGVYYCYSCWVAYDKTLTSSFETPSYTCLGFRTYTIDELMTIRRSPLSSGPLRANELGFKDDESLAIMLQRLSGPKNQKNKNNKKSKKNSDQRHSVPGPISLVEASGDASTDVSVSSKKDPGAI